MLTISEDISLGQCVVQAIIGIVAFAIQRLVVKQNDKSNLALSMDLMGNQLGIFQHKNQYLAETARGICKELRESKAFTEHKSPPFWQYSTNGKPDPYCDLLIQELTLLLSRFLLNCRSQEKILEGMIKVIESGKSNGTDIPGFGEIVESTKNVEEEVIRSRRTITTEVQFTIRHNGVHEMGDLKKLVDLGIKISKLQDKDYLEIKDFLKERE
jgi:hypothetical protein